MKYVRMTDEDYGNIQLGFLPSAEHILAIIANTNYYAVTDVKGEKHYCMLVGWAYLKNGKCMPLIYDHEFHTLRNPEVLENFIRIDDGEGEEVEFDEK